MRDISKPEMQATNKRAEMVHRKLEGRKEVCAVQYMLKENKQRR
jgi:hypothetical protein